MPPIAPHPVAESDSCTLMDRLKAETRAAHESTEAIPYSAAILDRTLPRGRFVGQLIAYREIHGALDSALASSADPVVAAVWDPAMQKTALLDADLAFFGPEAVRPADAEPVRDATAAAQSWVARIREVASDDPVCLLGFLYVLEGSMLGAAILRQHLAAAYGLADGRGLSYQSPYGPSPMPNWMQFKARMNAAVTAPDEQKKVVAAAEEAFRRIGEVLRALSADLPR